MDTSLKNIDFAPLTEVKAKLSEKVALVDREGKLVAITLNGKPKVVMVPYEDFLGQLCKESAPKRRYNYAEWLKGLEQKREVSQSIKNLFDLTLLDRKGQKPYKQNALKKFRQP